MIGKADPSKLFRLRSSLQFALLHVRNLERWCRDDLEGGALAWQLRELTWRLIDIDEQLREIVYRGAD